VASSGTNASIDNNFQATNAFDPNAKGVKKINDYFSKNNPQSPSRQSGMVTSRKKSPVLVKDSPVSYDQSTHLLQIGSPSVIQPHQFGDISTYQQTGVIKSTQTDLTAQAVTELVRAAKTHFKLKINLSQMNILGVMQFYSHRIQGKQN